MTDITISESGCQLSDYFAKVSTNDSSFDLGLKFNDEGDVVNVFIGEGSDAQDIFVIVDDYFLWKLEDAVGRFKNDRD